MGKLKETIKNVNSKRLVKILTFVLGLVLVIISTAVDAGLDPNKWNFYEWIGKTLILVGIMVYGLFMGESIGKDIQESNTNGLYQTTLSQYNTLNKSLEPIIIYFSQFYYNHIKKTLRLKKIDYLKEHDVDIEWCELIVDNCTTKDIWALSSEAGLMLEKLDIVIPQQNEEQLEAIRYVLSGKVKASYPKPYYYQNAFADSKVRYDIEEPERIDKQIAFNRNINRALKIFTSLAISIFWSMITVNEFMGGDDAVAQAQAWNNLISRITALFTSFVSGWTSSVIDTKLRARKVKGKYDMLIKFKSSYDNKEFIPMSAKELARKKYEEVKAREVKVEVVALENKSNQIEMKTIEDKKE